MDSINIFKYFRTVTTWESLTDWKNVPQDDTYFQNFADFSNFMTVFFPIFKYHYYFNSRKEAVKKVQLIVQNAGILFESHETMDFKKEPITRVVHLILSHHFLP